MTSINLDDVETIISKVELKNVVIIKEITNIKLWGELKERHYQIKEKPRNTAEGFQKEKK